MSNRSPRDENRVTTLKGALDSDGKTIVNILSDPTSHVLSVMDGTTGSDFGTTNAQRDDDRIPVLMATSSADDLTPVQVYADSNGNLLVKST